MHEYSVAESLLTALLKQLQQENVSHVQSLTFRRSSAFSESALGQTFEVLSKGTVLEGAELIVEVNILNIHCEGCGLVSTVHSDNLLGHLFVCPDCGTVRDIEEAHDLELVEVIAETG